MRVLDRKLLRDVWRLKAQILAIAMIVGAGIAIVVMSFGTMRSLSDTRDAYYDRAQFADVFARVKRAPRSLVAEIAEIPGVARVEARVVVDVTLDLPEMDAPASARVVSLPPDGRAGLNQVIVRRGQYPEATDAVLVSEDFADAHRLRPGDRLVAVFNGKKRSLSISGMALSPEFIYALPPGELVPDNRRYAVLWMNEEPLAAAFDLDGAFNDLALRLGRGASEPDVIASVDRLLDRYGGGGAYPRKDQQSHAFVSSELDQQALFGRIIPPIFLGVAAFLLNMVIARLIDTERELIGLFKAAGYSDWAVASHYVKFALIVVALGAALGVAGGAWLGQLLTELYGGFYKFPFLFYRLAPGVVALAILVSLVAGLGGALAAAWRVARLSPAVAMAPPAPMHYRRLVPRIRPLALDQASRMVLRHLARFPLRTLATVFGIALSVAGLVASLFALDAIDVMIEHGFSRTQRQDMTIALTEPRALSALDAVRQLPGVLAAEPLRATPVRLVNGARARRVAIEATPGGARLSQLVDLKQGVVSMPETGLVLSDALAQRLDAKRGESILVEVLEGRRARVLVPVSAITEEYVGLSARMELEALSRILGETPTMNGARVSLDRAQEAEFHRAVKRLPLVLGVSDVPRAVASFRATVAENIEISLAIYYAFAGLIAFGVLYNSVRVTLSERARELASLRVLGLTVSEAAYVLVAQVALMSLMALPVGCVAGYGLASMIVAGIETDLFRVPLAIDRATYGSAMLTVVVAAAASAAVGVWRVRQIDLIGVLKTRE